MESAAFDPTPDEQALLEECISLAMPKSKSRHSHKTKYDSHPRNNSKKDKQTLMSKSGEFSLKSGRPDGNTFKMSHSCSDASEMEHMTTSMTRESRYSSWKKTQVQKSLEEDSSASGQQLPCQRSNSHDSNLSKERKDSTNKEIALMGNHKQLHEDRPTENPGDCNVKSGIQNHEDLLHQSQNCGNASEIADSFNSEKFDSEKSETDDSYFNLGLTGSGLISGSVSLTDHSVEDLMKISSPERFCCRHR